MKKNEKREPPIHPTAEPVPVMTIKEVVALVERSIQRARQLADNAEPELLTSLEDGDVSLHTADQQTRKPIDPVVAADPSIVRQAWLVNALVEARLWFQMAGYPVPSKVRVSISRLRRGQAGLCCSPNLSSDGHYEIFIAPVTNDSVQIIETLIHEMVHTLAPGHGKGFKKIALAVGLEAPMKSSTAGPKLVAWTEDFVRQHGPYPGGILDIPPPQPRRSKPLKIGNWNSFFYKAFACAKRARESLHLLPSKERAKYYPIAEEILGSWHSTWEQLKPPHEPKPKKVTGKCARDDHPY